MDALYDFLPVPSANAEDTTPRLYPKIVSKVRKADRTNRQPFQDHRLARPEQMDGSTPYRHRRTRAAPGVCEVRI